MTRLREIVILLCCFPYLADPVGCRWVSIIWKFRVIHLFVLQCSFCPFTMRANIINSYWCWLQCISCLFRLCVRPSLPDYSLLSICHSFDVHLHVAYWLGVTTHLCWAGHQHWRVLHSLQAHYCMIWMVTATMTSSLLMLLGRCGPYTERAVMWLMGGHSF